MDATMMIPALPGYSVVEAWDEPPFTDYRLHPIVGWTFHSEGAYLAPLTWGVAHDDAEYVLQPDGRVIAHAVMGGAWDTLEQFLAWHEQTSWARLRRRQAAQDQAETIAEPAGSEEAA